ncbi:diguanylate cyclase [Psychromonas sp. SP041]|uniref:diguanylate cyclase n=1 Tax=Psychromonas sp. SP041 TaxID=1365007 RepID=UPI00040ACC98|nr:diguanylate cyclase [Psychromonas sp. SP041]
MFHSIKAKIITIYSLVMIAFTSLLLLTIFLNERHRMLDLELAKSTEISQMHASMLSQDFAKDVSILKVLSDDFKTVSNDKESLVTLLKKLMWVGDGDFINAIYVDKNLDLTDVNGRTMKAIHPMFLRADQWDDKEYYISNPIHSRFAEEPVIIISVPVRDQENKWSGTVAVAMPITLLPKKLSSIKLGKESYAWLVDANGLVVSHPLKNFILVNKISTNVNPKFPGFNEIVKKTQSQNNGYGSYMDKNLDESKVVTFSKLEYLPGWILFVTTEESEIFRDIYEIIFNVLIISAILMAVFLIFISQLSNKVTKPIIKLTKEIKASVNSKHDYFEGVYSNDEIGQLSKAFQSSFKKIRSHTVHLEKMVMERTEEISSKNALLSEQNDKLEELVSKDPLTHLYNRRAFISLLDKELARAKRHGSTITLAVLDIDHFKAVNDNFGHNVGDEVLCTFANKLTANMRAEDLICRWGGEEFVILLWEATADGTFNRMDMMREQISQLHFDGVGKVTFSTGMATMKEDEEFKDWLHRADEALYKAKETGRNRIVKS